MRKLKLQMQISLDGLVGPASAGENFNWGSEAQTFSIENLKSVDCILLGGKTGEPFVKHWTAVGNDPTMPDHPFGKAVSAIQTAIFSTTIEPGKWKNVTILKGDFKKEIEALKNKEGKDILVYGGHTFVSSLIQHGLVDEFYFLVNPVALSKGEPIFQSLKDKLQLQLKECRPFSSGTVLLVYQPTAASPSPAKQ